MTIKKTLSLYTADPHPCSYRENKEAINQYIIPPEAVNTSVYSQAILKGYRRSGDLTYRTRCENCLECIPVRIISNQFRCSNNQKKVIKKHQQLLTSIHEPYFSDEHYKLYRTYQTARHPGGGMDTDNVEQYIQFIVQSYVDTRLIEFRDSKSRELQMLSVIDYIQDGISSVYTFYNPNISTGSLGTYNILWQIAHAKQFAVPYVYLGYYIASSPKMNYKMRFQPLEYFWDNEWTTTVPQIHSID